MAALEAGGEVAQRRPGDADHECRQIQGLGSQATRIGQRLAAIGAHLDRQDVEDLALAAEHAAADLLERPIDVVVVDHPPADLTLDGDQPRRRPAARPADGDLAQRLAGRLLGLADHGQHRGLGRLGVDHLAGLEALGQLVAAAEQDEAAARPWCGRCSSRASSCRCRAGRRGRCDAGGAGSRAVAARPSRRLGSCPLSPARELVHKRGRPGELGVHDLVGEANDDAIVEPEIDRLDRAREQPLLALQPGQPMPGGRRARSRAGAPRCGRR